MTNEWRMTAPVQGSEPEHLMQSCWMGMDEDTNFFKLQLQEQELDNRKYDVCSSWEQVWICRALSRLFHLEIHWISFTLLLTYILLIGYYLHTYHAIVTQQLQAPVAKTRSVKEYLANIRANMRLMASNFGFLANWWDPSTDSKLLALR